MTVDEVVLIAHDIADDLVRVLDPDSVQPREDRLCAAILALVAAEREACAQVCEQKARDFDGTGESTMVTEAGKLVFESMAAGARECAHAIRARVTP